MFRKWLLRSIDSVERLEQELLALLADLWRRNAYRRLPNPPHADGSTHFLMPLGSPTGRTVVTHGTSSEVMLVAERLAKHTGCRVAVAVVIGSYHPTYPEHPDGRFVLAIEPSVN